MAVQILPMAVASLYSKSCWPKYYSKASEHSFNTLWLTQSWFPLRSSSLLC